MVLFNTRQRGSTWVQTDEPYVMSTILRDGVPAFADVAVATPVGTGHRQGFPTGSGATASRVAGSLVDANYFSLLGVRPALGRFFAPDDEQPNDPRKSAVLGYGYWQRQYAGRRDAVGRTMEIGTSRYTIVGVAPKGFTGTELRDVDVVRFFGYTLVVRTRGDADNYVEPPRRAMQSAGASVPYANVTTMRAMLGPQTRAWELGARVFSAFGMLALALAAIGLFSVVAFTINQRRHEFGVRTALGAQRADLLRLTIVRGVSPAVAGIVVGAGLAVLGSRFSEGLLFQESARHPVVIGAACGVLLVCAVGASVGPAIGAARVDPTIALRAE